MPSCAHAQLLKGALPICVRTRASVLTMVPTSSVIAQAGGQDDIAPQVRAVQDRQCLL